MSDRLFALRLFARVARKGSFSAASRELNILQSTASRTIAVLERQIGVVLFVRTTRAVTLTDTGSDFLARIEPLLVELDEAEHAARGTGELRGILRIGLGTNFAGREIIRRLAVFMSRHPALQIDLMMADQRQDLVAKASTSRFASVLSRIRQQRREELSHGCASLPPRELTSTRQESPLHLRICPSMQSFSGPAASAGIGLFARMTAVDLLPGRGPVERKGERRRDSGCRRGTEHRHGSACRVPPGSRKRRTPSGYCRNGTRESSSSTRSMPAAEPPSHQHEPLSTT